MDFLTVPTIMFELSYVLSVIDDARRVVRHVNTTRHPTSAWIRQQLREASPPCSSQSIPQEAPAPCADTTTDIAS